MSMRHPPVESVGLIFDWAARLDRRRRLLVWLLVALVLHVVIIVALGHKSPKVNYRQPDEATLFVASPEESRGLAAYISASNPALFAPGEVRDGLIADPSPPKYRPSFDTMDFKPVPLPRGDVRIVPTVDARLTDSVKSAKNVGDAVRAAGIPATTQIRFSPSLQARASDVEFPRTSVVQPDGDFTPSEFLIAVNRDGGVHHVFPRSTTRISSEAVATLQDLLRARFQPSETADDLTWGTVTVYWGLGGGPQP